jgi:hypothetical protein
LPAINLRHINIQQYDIGQVFERGSMVQKVVDRTLSSVIYCDDMRQFPQLRQSLDLERGHRIIIDDQQIWYFH